MSVLSKEEISRAFVAFLEESDPGMSGRVGDADLPSGDRSQSGYLPAVAVYLVPGGERWGALYAVQDSENVDFVVRSVGSSPTSARRMSDHVRRTALSGAFTGYSGWACISAELTGEPGGVDRDDEGQFKVWSVTETYRLIMTATA